MGLFRRGPAGERCPVCKTPMEERWTRLYAMPSVLAGQYTERKSGDWYRRNLVPIDTPDRIPSGIYAARVTLCRCPACGREKAMIRPFLPVRGREVREFPVTLEFLELEAFLREDS